MVEEAQAQDIFQEVLIEEIEQLLDEAAPDEIDSAMLYVVSPEEFKGEARNERAFGIPGGGVAYLVGPLLLDFVVQIAITFLKEFTKQGLETSVKLALDYLLHRLKSDTKIEAAKKEDTITAIKTALIKAGWEASKAAETAEKVWNAGVKTGERMSGVS